MMEKIELEDFYDKFGYGSKNYQEFLSRSSVKSFEDFTRRPLESFFFLHGCKYLVFVAMADRNYHGLSSVYDMDYYLHLLTYKDSFESIMHYVLDYFEAQIKYGDGFASVFIATKENMVSVNHTASIDDFKVLDLEKDELNLLRRTLFEIKLMY